MKRNYVHRCNEIPYKYKCRQKTTRGHFSETTFLKYHFSFKPAPHNRNLESIFSDRIFRNEISPNSHYSGQYLKNHNEFYAEIKNLQAKKNSL